MKIIWSWSARDDLKAIYRYYTKNAGIPTARKIKANFFIRVRILKQFPLTGQEEEVLKNLNERHRYLVEGNFKIIYKIVDGIAYITDVFDIRQNPPKLTIKKRFL